MVGLIRKFLSELVDWVIYYPLFKTGKITQLEVITFRGETFEVVTTKTRVFSKALYSVSKVPGDEDNTWRDGLVRQGVIVKVKNLGDTSIDEFRKAHKALKKFDPKLNLRMQF
jgi:hypothetical protein